MKKTLFTLILLTLLSVSDAIKISAQIKVIKPDQNAEYNATRDAINMGDEMFRSGTWASAEFYYKMALEHNGNCTDRKYISDAEINRKLDEVRFAMHHNGMTRQQYNEEQRNAAAANVAGAIAGAISQGSNSSSQQSATSADEDNNVLRHITTNGISYDTNNTYTKITKIEKTSNATVIHLEELDLKNSRNIKINPNTYIKDRTNDQKYVLTGCDGIYTDKALLIDAGDCHDFTLTFPAVSQECHEIDLVEPITSPYSWKFYHIKF